MSLKNVNKYVKNRSVKSRLNLVKKRLIET